MPQSGPQRRADTDADFLAQIDKRKNGCWEWTGRKGPQGYGDCKFRGQRLAHRAAWELFRGPIPKGLSVLRKEECDSRSCVNPDHLFLGTVADNTHRRFTPEHRARLSEAARRQWAEGRGWKRD